jgi:hypothetical protein
VLRQLVKVIVDIGDEKELREYPVDELRFQSRRRKDVKLTAEEIKELQGLEDDGNAEEGDEPKNNRNRNDKGNRRNNREDGGEQGNRRNNREDGNQQDNRGSREDGSEQGNRRNNRNNRRNRNRNQKNDNNRGNQNNSQPEGGADE